MRYRLYLFADDVASYTSLAGIVVNVGFAGLVGWYLLTKALPNMQKENQDAISGQRKDFLAEMAQKRLDFLHDDKERRDSFRDAMNVLTQHCEKEMARRDDSFRVEMTLVTKAMNDMREVLEEVRDSLRDFRARRRLPKPQGDKP